jgi:NAD(P)H-hydrate epimerase
LKIVTAEQMREIDRRTIQDIGIPSLVLMERAGESVAVVTDKLFQESPVVIVAGGGNNGGDGFVAARVLKGRGYEVRVLLLADEKALSHDCRVQYNAAKEMNIPVAVKNVISRDDLGDSVIIDALLGTGLNRPVEGIFHDAIKAINSSGASVLSVDIPSGISSDTGVIMGQAVRADYTVTFGLPKLGHVLHPGAEYTGKLFIEDIGFPLSLLESEELKNNVIELGTVRQYIKKRQAVSHKGTYGHVFVIAGSEGKAGAAHLSARACLRAGAGAVTIGLPEMLFSHFQSRVFEEMTVLLPSNDIGTISRRASDKALDFIHNHADTVLIGPGLGANEDIAEFVKNIVSHSDKPLLIDADGLNNIAQWPDVLTKAKTGVVVTPHPGEMKRLLVSEHPDITIREINERRVEIARDYAAKRGVACVLKGVPTVVSSPEGEVYLNTTGNPGMATAGSGDVLSGVIASFIAQGFGVRRSAVCGVFMHGLAGDKARDEVGEYSLTAGDIVKCLPSAFKAVFRSG